MTEIAENSRRRVGPSILRAPSRESAGRRDPQHARDNETGEDDDCLEGRPTDIDRAEEGRRSDPAPSRRPRVERAGARMRRMPASPDEASRRTHAVDDPVRYVIAALEGFGGRLTGEDRAALAAAGELADEQTAVVALVVCDIADLGAAGADRVVKAAPSAPWEEIVASAVGKWLEDPAIVAAVFPHTTLGRHAARLCAVAAGETAMVGAHHISQKGVVRSAFGGTMDVSHSGARILTAQSGARIARRSCRHEARPFERELCAPAARRGVEDLGRIAVNADDIDLEEAPFILAAGAGVRDWTAFEEAARRLNATRAGTRIACDQGHLPRSRQIGASGRASTADVYVALGVSGAIQHLQGIEGCARVIAVNIDPFAPIFKRADLSIVADADSTLRALVARIEERR